MEKMEIQLDTQSASATKASWTPPSVQRLRTDQAENDVTSNTDDGINPS